MIFHRYQRGSYYSQLNQVDLQQQVEPWISNFPDQSYDDSTFQSESILDETQGAVDVASLKVTAQQAL